MGRRPPESALFPYATLFRSSVRSRTIAGASGTECSAIGRRVGDGAGAGAGAGVAGRRLRSSCCAISSPRSEEHTSELQSRLHLVCRLLLEKKTIGHLATAGL